MVNTTYILTSILLLLAKLSFSCISYVSVSVITSANEDVLPGAECMDLHENFTTDVSFCSLNFVSHPHGFGLSIRFSFALAEVCSLRMLLFSMD